MGLEFTSVFAEAEQLTLNIVDTWRLIILEIEAPPLNPMLYVAPIFNVKNPKTTLSSWGTYLPTPISQAAWLALQNVPPQWSGSTTYNRGTLVTSPFNGWQQYRAIKKSTGQNPTVSPTYWTPLQSPATWQGYYFNPVTAMYTLGIAQYAPNTVYYAGQFVIDYNGNLQIAGNGGTSGVSVTFNPTTGGETDDNGIVWKNYLTDPSRWIQILDKNQNPTGEISNWTIAMPMGLVAPRENLAWEVKSDTFNSYNLD